MADIPLDQIPPSPTAALASARARAQGVGNSDLRFAAVEFISAMNHARTPQGSGTCMAAVQGVIQAVAIHPRWPELTRKLVEAMTGRGGNGIAWLRGDLDGKEHPQLRTWNEYTSRTIDEVELAGLHALIAASTPEATGNATDPINAKLDGGTHIVAKGFLGGAELVKALGIHPTKREAFFQQLGRKRPELGDRNWQEVKDRKPNDPQFIYRADAPEVQDVAAKYKSA